MSVDLLFLTHNRLEFTKASLDALYRNTEWKRVSGLWLFDDASEDGTLELVAAFSNRPGLPKTVMVAGTFGSPIEAMREFFQVAGTELVVKIDSDVMLPPGWLGDALDVMEKSPEVDLLGIEARGETYRSKPSGSFRVADPAKFIGGIGIFRLPSIREALQKMSLSCDWHSGKWFGWQSFQSVTQLRPAWIEPSLNVFLLDRMPLEPWASLSDEYVRKGWQRPAPYRYGPEWSGLWRWSPQVSLLSR